MSAEFANIAVLVTIDMAARAASAISGDSNIPYFFAMLFIIMVAAAASPCLNNDGAPPLVISFR